MDTSDVPMECKDETKPDPIESDVKCEPIVVRFLMRATG